MSKLCEAHVGPVLEALAGQARRNAGMNGNDLD